MGIEIERKFLIDKDLFKETASPVKTLNIVQGCLSLDPVVRIRIMEHYGSKYAFITIKGKMVDNVCPEYEYEIPIEDGEELILTCKKTMSKTRYYIPFAGTFIEIDEFHDDNDGLIVAELELRNLDDPLYSLSTEEILELLPEWITKEVSGETRYYNSQLVIRPYNTWNTEWRNDV